MSRAAFSQFILILSCACLLLPGPLFGQYYINGQIADSTSATGIEAAHVFITQSTIGSLSTEEGAYRLGPISAGSYQIVVSHLGYEPFIKQIEVSAADLELDIILNPLTIELDEVTVLAEKTRKRSKYLKRFSTEFLGHTENGKKSEILNPEVLLFEEQSDESLLVKARDLLIIENHNTGYRITFLLEHFLLKGETVAYSGKPLFEALASNDKKEEKRRDAKRTESYNGSLRHFMESLAADRLKENGFLIAHAFQRGDKLLEVKSADRDEVYAFDEEEGLWHLKIPAFLKVTYTKEKDKLSQNQDNREAVYDRLGRPEERTKGLNAPASASSAQISYLFGRKDKIALGSNAMPLQPELLLEYGYWNFERVADLLPFDYTKSDAPVAAKPLNIRPRKVRKMNGIALSKLTIPDSEIRHGGPPKDGIKSIDQPNFVAANKANFLLDSDHVLGVEFNGITKAYPLKIMDWHEVVNDAFGTTPVVVTYCPLCGSGMAFLSEVAGTQLTFGVSGLLYNSDVLLYDRQTESLWSQIMMQAVSGDYSGTELQLLPTRLTSWGSWKAAFPDTKVLSIYTGFDRDYDQMAYETYRHSNTLMFPVSKTSAKLKRKEMVLGVEVEGVYKAYPYKKLSKHSHPVTDEINGISITIQYDPEGNTAHLVAPKAGVHASSMYWFAWYAFHPETKIFE